MNRVLPILFNTEMVRAILDGRKSCMRRICKDGNEYTVPDMNFYNADRRTYAVHNYADKEHTDKLSTAERTCPICPGDILYIRETWSPVFIRPRRYLYKVECKDVENLPIKWHPSIHMPKEATRIWLKVTDVRVERLQDITEVQAQAEGCNSGLLTGACTARGQFEDLWNSTIKKSDLDRYGWDTNPYVWVIEFERCEKSAESPYAWNDAIHKLTKGV